MADKFVTVKPSGGTYTILQGAITGELAANADLTALGVLTVSIEGDWSGGPDTTAVVINGFITDATHYLKIITDASNRALKTGISASRYILNTGAAAQSIEIVDGHVWVDGLQIQGNDGKYALYTHDIPAGGWLKVSNCYITNSYGIVQNSANETTYCWNTIFSGNNRGTLGWAGNSYFYNCTKCNGASDGMEFDAGTHTIINCAVFNNADDFDTAGATVTIDHCASDDGDGTNDVAESGGGATWTGDFVDAANGDFTLKSTSGLVGTGTDNPGSGLYSDDIDSVARTSTWDIGADEYVAAGGSIVPLAMHHYKQQGTH
jgi:hypothetical protein